MDEGYPVMRPCTVHFGLSYSLIFVSYLSKNGMLAQLRQFRVINRKML